MDFEQIIELIDHVSASELSSFHYENGDTKISMKAGEKSCIRDKYNRKKCRTDYFKRRHSRQQDNKRRRVEPEGKNH